MQRAGIRIKAPIRHARMDTTIKNPKNLTGMKFEISSTTNPIITENALNTMPLPVVLSVFLTASTEVSPFRLSSLQRQRK